MKTLQLPAIVLSMIALWLIATPTLVETPRYAQAVPLPYSLLAALALIVGGLGVMLASALTPKHR